MTRTNDNSEEPMHNEPEITPTPPPSPAAKAPDWQQDAKLCRAIARTLLDELRNAVDRDLPGNSEQQEAFQLYYDMYFGKRESLTGALVTLATLLLKLGAFEQQNASGAGGVLENFICQPLEDEDRAVMERYVERAQSQRAG